MSRKRVTKSLVAVIPVIDGSPEELAALDQMARTELKFAGRGRRMSFDDLRDLGVLVTVLQKLKASGKKIPRTYLSKQHMQNADLVRALLSLNVQTPAGLSRNEVEALRNGVPVSTNARERISRAASYYLVKAAKSI